MVDKIRLMLSMDELELNILNLLIFCWIWYRIWLYFRLLLIKFHTFGILKMEII